MLGAPGISLADSLAFTSQAVLLLALLNRHLIRRLSPGPAALHALLAAAVGGAVVYGILQLPLSISQPFVMGVVALAVGGILALPLIWNEIRLLLRL
jgi:putative peptidoglycan lipid II flippase